MSSFISYGKQAIDEEDIQAVVDVLRSDYLTQGPVVEQFEQAVAKYVGATYAVAFSNGTAALHGAYYAAGIQSGDEVITTPLTFAATANAVKYVGGVPIFADIDANTYNLDPMKVRELITPQTKALAPVDFTGQPADLEAFMQLAKEHQLVVIEDGAHSLGASYKGERVGSQADMTMFSFHPVKPITTGEGGIITTNSLEFYEKLILFRSHGITKTAQAKNEGDWYYEMVDLGFNYRMTDLQAALGLSQLTKLDAFIQRRRAIAKSYNQAFKGVAGLTIPYQSAESESGWHLYLLQVNEQVIGKSRKQLFNELRQKNIGVHVHYIPVYWHPYYQELGYKRGICPQAEQWYEQALTIPLHPSMTEDEVQRVMKEVKLLVKNNY